MTREDPELGTEKFCRHCGEWWPLDAEFWYVQRHNAGTRSGGYILRRSTVGWASRCRACWADDNMRRHRGRKGRAA